MGHPGLGRVMMFGVVEGLQKTYAVSADEMERIECQVDADPSKVDFKWSFSNTADRHYNVSFTSAGLRSVATYTPRSARDYGTLYWGKEFCPPETLQNCTSTNVTMTSVTILCVRGPRQDPDLKYNLEMFMYHSHEMIYQTSSLRPYFVITNLSPGTEFLFVVYAVNHNGKSSPVMVRVWTRRSPTEERVFLEENSTEDPSIDHSWIGPSLLIAVALCCFLMFTGAAIWSKLRGGPGCQKYKNMTRLKAFFTIWKGKHHDINT
ncbi:ig-like domain-containing protein [Caerostris extrusa]|uniref:Ig-like domain-containing protein n=1 Tax=Caerostris extrusa TaxID=172846 RepID=A0AAV4WGS0_CAEEX|nr:ig-like domain-containing protein [Caerostris extrusa]